MKFSFVFIASYIATVGAAVVINQTTESTMKLVINGLGQIERHFKKLDIAVDRFPETGVNGAKDIHGHEAAIHTLFSDLNANLVALSRPVSQENSKKIVELYRSFTPAIVHSFNGITAKAPAFAALSAATTMKQDIITSAAACKPLAQQLRAIASPGLTEAVSTIFDAIDRARDDSMAALQ